MFRNCGQNIYITSPSDVINSHISQDIDLLVYHFFTNVRNVRAEAIDADTKTQEDEGNNLDTQKSLKELIKDLFFRRDSRLALAKSYFKRALAHGLVTPQFDDVLKMCKELYKSS